MVHKHRMDVNAKWNWKRNKTIETLSCLANDNRWRRQQQQQLRQRAPNNFNTVHGTGTGTCSTRCPKRAFRCTCKNKSFHVYSNHSSRICFGRALLIFCISCAAFVFFSRCNHLAVLWMPEEANYFFLQIWCGYGCSDVVVPVPVPVPLPCIDWLVFQWATLTKRYRYTVSFAISFRSVDDPYFAR